MTEPRSCPYQGLTTFAKNALCVLLVPLLATLLKNRVFDPVYCLWAPKIDKQAWVSVTAPATSESYGVRVVQINGTFHRVGQT
jgi:hypothetical protein